MCCTVVYCRVGSVVQSSTGRVMFRFIGSSLAGASSRELLGSLVAQPKIKVNDIFVNPRACLLAVVEVSDSSLDNIVPY